LSCICQTESPVKQYSLRVLFLFALATLLEGCSTAARFEGMVPDSIETVTAHPQTVRISVTGGQESVALGRPQITDGAFSQALITSIIKSRTFAKVIEDQNSREDFLLTVTLFSTDKRSFGRTVKLEAGWTLRRAATGEVVWRESIISQSRHSNFRVATEGAARNNIAQALAKISKLNL
jgi:hypothetical protein